MGEIKNFPRMVGFGWFGLIVWVGLVLVKFKEWSKPFNIKC